jgi:hypothetical protein
MRIGFIVDGEAEYRSLPNIYARLAVSATLLTPLKSDIQPLAPVAQIAASVKVPLRIMRRRGADRVIILIDRETRNECPGEFAAALRTLLSRYCDASTVDIVTKDRRFENWLIADPDALEHLRGRFKLDAGQRSQIEPNKADAVDALTLLKRIVRRHDYSKVKDARRILAVAEPLRMARNSRSFRRLLRLIDHNSYRQQSRRP